MAGISVPVISFEVPEAVARGCLFPSEIADDPWICYHGTSGANEAKIEADGINGNLEQYSLKDVLDLCQIFRSINWYGNDGNGFSTLNSYSRADHLVDQRKASFFGGTSFRSARFAARRSAGGETIRGFRIAFRDLRDYLNRPEVRTDHLNQQIRQSMEYIRADAAPSRVMIVDEAWLEFRLSELAHIEQIAEQWPQVHTHGVVYAVRFSTKDVEWLRCNGFGGAVESYTPIAPTRLVAKVRLNDEQIDALPYWSEKERTKSNAFYSARGLFSAVLKNHPLSSAQERGLPPHIPLDAFAGVDYAQELVDKFGSPHLKEYMTNNPGARHIEVGEIVRKLVT